jgi:hypothetical protein
MTSMRMIADDSHLVRRGVTGNLAKEANCEVSAEASDASETIGKARCVRFRNSSDMFPDVHDLRGGA